MSQRSGLNDCLPHIIARLNVGGLKADKNITNLKDVTTSVLNYSNQLQRTGADKPPERLLTFVVGNLDY